MIVSEKAKEKLDEASKEIKEAIDNLKEEVSALTGKVKEKLKGAGEDMRESAEELTKEVKNLSDKVKELVPKRRHQGQLPVRVDISSEYQADAWERSFYIPCEVESDKVDASFKDGVLRVRLPKTATARERVKKIPVRTI
ncbi:MAG: Hsp20 family protein [Deltaproteobacteria bacterium]|nr:Hsp20 family protein [Deltaproteobacteria bacterium]